MDTHSMACGLGEALRGRGWRLATAESCTGGGLAALLTDIPGASDWFDRGYVTYSNDAKQDMLGVRRESLEGHGAVSEVVAREMAEGARARAGVEVSVSITGIAGPGGGSPAKPVGTVWIAWASSAQPTRARSFHFNGDRAQVREQAMQAALQGLLDGLA